MRTPDLTPREQETLQAVARRLANVEIAAELHVSVRTVESHIASLRRKLLAESRRELIAAAASYLGRPVPVPVDSFVGRSELLADVQSLVAGSRWVTLTGPAGVGKTRLALELAHRAPSVVVELERTEPGGVLGAIAAALALDTTTSGLATACAGALSGGSLQLVLDDADRVADDVAATVRSLLSQVDTLRVIVTSRMPLHGSGEVVVQVEPLPTLAPDDPAVRLFLDRARAAERATDLSETSRVVAICRRLDGIPLAIELAAARTRHLSLDELDRRLSDGFSTLGAGSNAGPRHATLSAAFAWSWDLLDDPLRLVLCQVAALPRSFDLDLASAAAGHDVSAEVIELVDRSFLARVPGADGKARYRVLAALREFVGDRTDSQLRDEVARRHAQHHRELAGMLAAGVRTDDTLTTRQLARVAYAEITDALRWAVVHDAPMAAELAVSVAVGIEQYGPGPGMTAALVGASEEPRLRVTWTAPELATIGRALSYLRTDLVTELATRAHEIATATQAQEDRLAAAALTGSALVYRGRAAEALRHLDAAVELATVLGDRWELGEALQARSKALQRLGRTSATDLLASYEAARTAYAAAGDSMHVNNTRYMMALVAASDPTLRPRALEWAEECLAYASRHGNETEIGHARLARALAGGNRRSDDLTEAVRLFRRVGDLRCLSRSLLLAASDDPGRDESLLREALEVGAASGDPTVHAPAAGALATMLWAADRRAEAAAVLGAAVAALPDVDLLALVPRDLAGDLGQPR